MITDAYSRSRYIRLTYKKLSRNMRLESFDLSFVNKSKIFAAQDGFCFSMISSDRVSFNTVTEYNLGSLYNYEVPGQHMKKNIVKKVTIVSSAMS